jgi:uncharacterized protein YbjT (DUF2867 family)
VTGWETSERVLESGGFESRQRVLVAEPVVEPSEAGARTLGVAYWQAVDRFTRGGVRASWRGGGGKLKLLGGATLLTFGPPELSFDGGLVSCRHAIQGGLLALRAGGSVTLAQRGEGDQQELSVTVEEYLPRLAVDRDALRERTKPLPCRGQPPLLRAPAAEPRRVNVTVFGATGVVGRALMPLLAEHELTAVSRTVRDEPGARWVVADAASGDGVAAALEDADVVYYLVHSLGARDFEEQDRVAAETVARETANAGVRQIVYLGGLGADGPDASPHLRSRRETGQRLASAGVPVTTLRAAMIIGKGSAAFETILGLVKRLPVMVTPSWVSTPTQPIALDDVARYLAGVCGNEATYGEGYDTGGPEVMTYRQMIERIADLLGRKPAIVEVPVLTPYLSSLWLNLVTPVNASVARPLVEGLRNPTIAREERIRKLLPLELTPFDEAARRALA